MKTLLGLALALGLSTSTALSANYGTPLTCDHLAKGGAVQDLEFMGKWQFYLGDDTLIPPRWHCRLSPIANVLFEAECRWGDQTETDKAVIEKVKIERTDKTATVTYDDGTAFILARCD